MFCLLNICDVPQCLVLGPVSRGVYIYSCGNLDSHKNFFCRAEISKSGCFVQKYSNQGISCRIRVFRAEILVRYRYALPSHARLTIWIGPNQTRLSQKILDSDFQTSPENGTKSMHYIIRGKFVISPCRKKIALFWIRAVILLFRAEILPCGPP